MKKAIFRRLSMTKRTTKIFALLLGVNLVLLTIYLFQSTTLLHSNTSFSNSAVNSEEVLHLSELKEPSFQEVDEYLKSIAEEKGAVYAFDVLRNARLPEMIDLHLLAHSIGDILYKQQGMEGIKVCTDEFRNACSHSIVIRTLLEHGESSIKQITELCKQAPGGQGAYTMCFHGLGHGVLAYTQYDLEKAAIMCEKMGTSGGEASECIGGSMMEMIGGVHDPEVWEQYVDKYLKGDDPLSPCNQDYIPEFGKYMCFTYLTPHLFEAAGANLGSPNPETFEEAFSFCEELEVGSQSRQACYGGFGKEFIVLVNDRDIRTMGDMTEDQLGIVYDWCKKAQVSDGIEHCMFSAMHSLFWGGENKPDASVRICKIIEEPELKESCFRHLRNAINHYLTKGEKKDEACEMIPKEYRKDC